jgi:glycerol-3-phosphate cytidylyltransferase-like family protein
VDTRNKILDPAEAAARIHRLCADGRSVRLITGFFDPLTPAHARRLNRLASENSHLTVIVTDPPDPILPLRARAELAAALAAVDLVVPVPAEQLDEFLQSLPIAPFERGEAEDLVLRQELIRHVHTRQRAS